METTKDVLQDNNEIYLSKYLETLQHDVSFTLSDMLELPVGEVQMLPLEENQCW